MTDPIEWHRVEISGVDGDPILDMIIEKILEFLRKRVPKDFGEVSFPAVSTCNMSFHELNHAVNKEIVPVFFGLVVVRKRVSEIILCLEKSRVCFLFGGSG